MRRRIPKHTFFCELCKSPCLIYKKGRSHRVLVCPHHGVLATNGLITGGLEGAATGAAIGSVIPGIGTGIGAAVGGALGAYSGYEPEEGARKHAPFDKKAFLEAAYRRVGRNHNSLERVKYALARG